MKKNIRQSKKDSLFWEWEEYCDRCGKASFQGSVKSTKKPGTNEVDFCLECLRWLMDNNVPYEEAAKQYKHPGMME